MQRRNRIQIVFAPLPEEERNVERSAAKEFAMRTANQFRTVNGSTDCVTDVSHLVDWDKDRFSECVSSVTSIEKESVKEDRMVVVFLISCGPDGSVHRQVRKTTKWFKEVQQTTQATREQKKTTEDEPKTLKKQKATAIIVLLGHSVCKTSAEQMADEVFSTGRRLAKSIQSAIPLGTGHPSKPLLEIQVELESPEEKFDGWVKSWSECLMEK